MPGKLWAFTTAIKLSPLPIELRTLFWLGHCRTKHRLSSPARRSLWRGKMSASGLARVADRWGQSNSAFELLSQVGLLPGEATLGIRLAAEMAIGGGTGIDRLVETQMLADAARLQAHQL